MPFIIALSYILYNMVQSRELIISWYCKWKQIRALQMMSLLYVLDQRGTYSMLLFSVTNHLFNNHTASEKPAARNLQKTKRKGRTQSWSQNTACNARSKSYWTPRRKTAGSTYTPVTHSSRPCTDNARAHNPEPGDFWGTDVQCTCCISSLNMLLIW